MTTKLKGRERTPVAFRAAGRAKRGGRSRPFAVLARVLTLGLHARIAFLDWRLKRARAENRKEIREENRFQDGFYTTRLFM